MSVTESKAKRLKKASPKASTRKADAQSDVWLPYWTVPCQLHRMVPPVYRGSQLPSYPAHAGRNQGYADSIFAVGQIHNIVVVECDDGRLEVVCGGGRTKAIGLLVEEGKVDPDHEWISCKVVPRELARAIS